MSATQNIIHSPYFFDGFHSDSNMLYGLYEAVGNRFVIVSEHTDILQKCILLLSSKAQLYTVALKNAANYTPTLIDNHCCHNWGLSQVNQDSLFSFPVTGSHTVIDPAPDLAPNLSPVSNTWRELQQLAFLAHSVVQFWHQNTEWYYRDFYDFVSWPQSLQQLKILERSIYHIIYSCENYESCCAALQAPMSQSQTLLNNTAWPTQ